jgi:hypothetical protein
MLKLFDRPVAHYHENRFVITEDKAWFVPYRRELDWPAAMEILAAIFDLDDPAVHESVDRMLDDGLIVIGSYFPSSGEVIVQVPLEPSEYTRERIGEVFGDA